MVEVLTIIYLTYSFVAMYFLFLFLLIYIPHRKKIFLYPETEKNYSLSIVVPCYNEAESIGETIQRLLDSNYKGLKKIIVVDDCSTDNSYEVIKKYAKKYSRVLAVQTPKNTGRASGAKNYGFKFVKTNLIGFVDADSYPDVNAIGRMIGFFDDEKVGAVTSQVLVKNRNNLIEKMQAIEYKIIVFTRKLLVFIDAIYVTPWPLAIYRKTAFDKVKGFDESNLTEDIEITWHLVYAGYTVRMCVPALVYTIAPSKFKDWFKQRIRWNVGGLQTIKKYNRTFLKKGMLGNFILPFFVFSWGLGIFGLFVLSYRIARKFIVQYLSTKYAIGAQTAILTLRDLNLTPNVLVFFGLMILIFSIWFTLLVLFRLKEKEFKQHSLWDMFSYMFIYLVAYPFLLVISIYKFLRRKQTW